MRRVSAKAAGMAWCGTIQGVFFRETVGRIASRYHLKAYSRAF